MKVYAGGTSSGACCSRFCHPMGFWRMFGPPSRSTHLFDMLTYNLFTPLQSSMCTGEDDCSTQLFFTVPWARFHVSIRHTFAL